MTEEFQIPTSDNASKLNEESEVVNVVLMGEKGAGKSTFLNYVANSIHGGWLGCLRTVVPTIGQEVNVCGYSGSNSDRAATTAHCQRHSFTKENVTYNFLDTPGLNASVQSPADKGLVDVVLTEAAKGPPINVILFFVLNAHASNPEVLNYVRECIERKGGYVCKQIIVMYTHAGNDAIEITTPKDPVLRSFRVNNSAYSNRDWDSDTQWEQQMRNWEISIAITKEVLQLAKSQPKRTVTRVETKIEPEIETITVRRNQRITEAMPGPSIEPSIAVSPSPVELQDLKSGISEALSEMLIATKALTALGKQPQFVEDPTTGGINQLIVTFTDIPKPAPQPSHIYPSPNPAEAVDAVVKPEEHKEPQQDIKITFSEFKQSDYHNTLCATCHSMCHENCGLKYMPALGDMGFEECECMSGGPPCYVCGCGVPKHYHDRRIVHTVTKPLLEYYADKSGELESRNADIKNFRGEIDNLKQELALNRSGPPDKTAQIKTALHIANANLSRSTDAFYFNCAVEAKRTLEVYRQVVVNRLKELNKNYPFAKFQEQLELAKGSLEAMGFKNPFAGVNLR